MLIGILADTHIPYRVPTLPAYILEAFRDVDMILHAGDVDEPIALSALEKIAPVRAVSGNYHVIEHSSGGKQLPAVQKLHLCGYNIVMTHGHRMGWTTLFWRMYVLFIMATGKTDSPVRDQYISRKLVRSYPDADIYIFGHTHRFFTQNLKGKLVINPGAASASSYFNAKAETTVALLRLESGKPPRVVRVDIGK